MRVLLPFLIFLLVAVRTTSAADRLPRVLILGDVIYQQPARDAAKELKDRVDVEFTAIPPGKIRNTEMAIQSLDTLLGTGPWDLIHFNFGLGDLVYRAPNMRSFRVMSMHAGGVRAVSPQLYEKNLNEIVLKLKETGARLVWASTTPIRHSSSFVFQMDSEVQYNVIAARVMAKHEIPTNDMYTYVRDLIDMKRPASHGADPFYFDRKPLHPPIVQTIVDQLKLKETSPP